MSKILSSLITLLILPLLLIAQPDEVFMVVEQMPVFEGCDVNQIPADKLEECSNQKMLEFVFNNLRYPQEARDKSIEGTVIATFIVNEKGLVTNVRIEKGLGTACNEEVIRVVNAMPKWTPGIAQGKPVPITLFLPVQFALDEKGRSDSPSRDPYNRSDNPPPPRKSEGNVPPPPPPPSDYEEETFIVVEQMPTFGSCDDPTHQERKACSDEEIRRYFTENIKVPELLETDQQELSTAVIRFTVKANGEIADVVFLRSTGNDEIDQHILEVAQAMPDWRPGLQRGRPVPVLYTIPIRINQQ